MLGMTATDGGYGEAHCSAVCEDSGITTKTGFGGCLERAHDGTPDLLGDGVVGDLGTGRKDTGDQEGPNIVAQGSACINRHGDSPGINDP